MIKSNKAEISKLIIHKVSNKFNGGKNTYSDDPIRWDEESYELMLPYLLKPFGSLVLSHRFHNPATRLNQITDKVLNDDKLFLEQSKEIVEHLYNQSGNSANIKTGDVLVVHFQGVEYQDILVDAIGVFKIEKKSQFFQTYLDEEDSSFDIVTQSGISIKKFDKGCLILNTVDDHGRVVLSIDTNNYDANYWYKDFLNVRYSDDKNFHTHTYLDMCKQFSSDSLMSKKVKGEFLSASLSFFNCNDTATHEDFKDEVFENEEHKGLFDTYKNTYQAFNDVVVRNNFDISYPVVKKEKSKLKTDIKLDTGIKIMLDVEDEDAAKEHLEVGYDEEKKMKYYKVYFNSEK